MMKRVLLLLVEDDSLVQYVVSEMLVDAGFEVIIASSGFEGLAKLDEQSQLGGVVTDIKLGDGPDGWEIGRRARDISEDMPIVYITGDSSKEWQPKGVSGSLVLAKPFAPDQIVGAISTLLAAQDGQC